MSEVILYILVLNVCHFLGDYTHLSTSWMLNAKRTGWPPLPIICHALVHASLMFVATTLYLIWTGVMSWSDVFIFKYDILDSVFIFQFLTHLAIDSLKGRMNVWFPSFASPANKQHWYAFGLDQLAHQIVILIIAVKVYS